MQSRKAKVHPPGRLMGAGPIPDMQRSTRNWMLQSRKAKERAPMRMRRLVGGYGGWAGMFAVEKNGSDRQKQFRLIIFAATEFCLVQPKNFLISGPSVRGLG